MIELVHEIWETPNEDGRWRPGVCLAGPDGDDFRGLLAAGSRLVHTFKAGSHFEAMNTYYEWGKRPYLRTTDQPWDFEPYREEWLERQLSRVQSDRS